MIDYLPGIGPKSPYRKTRDALLLQRLCADAWRPFKDCPIPQSIVDDIRAATIRAALSETTDEEADVLAKFGCLSVCRRATLKVQLEPNRGHFAHVHVDLECEIGVPSHRVDSSGRTIVVPTPQLFGSRPLNMGIDFDENAIAFLRDRDAARRGYEAELAHIVAISRGAGAPATWERMLETIPVTRDHFMASLTEPEALAA